jgi:sRNA-binding regulator protein Hfq
LSTHRSGSYARFYSFSLASQTQVQIDLASSATDPYVFLLNGAGTSGSIAGQDDDSGDGNSARIVRTLSAGSYTIEATTFYSQRTGSFSLRLSQVGGSPPSSCSLAPISVGQTLGGSWGTDCASPHRSGNYARFYSFSLASQAQVQIDLSSSATDPYLLLLNGAGTSGSIVAQDDDSGDGNSARIVRTLAAGSYTIESTTYYSQQTGSFSLRLSQVGGSPPSSCTLAPISMGQTLGGSWGTDCPSPHRSGNYARFYSFSLASQAQVQIDLSSSATDPYVFLLNGAGTSGSIVAQDDDSGDGNSARVVRTLSAGSYTIEATTYYSQQTGSFSLRLSQIGGSPPSSCSVATISMGQTIGGSWGTDCASAHRSGSYARFYSFSLASQTQVQIDLSSSATDPYVFLLNGVGTSGSIVAQDDDSGDGNSARVVRTLSAGSYTIEATPYYSQTTGSFALTLRSPGIAVFIVHGIRQSSADIDSFATNLRSRLDSQKFTVDSGFDFSSCTQTNGCDSTLCTIPVGAGLLGNYINSRASSRPVVVIGFSLGGLLARDMMLHNRHGVADSRRIAQLITLGTPNAGYPYCIDDRSALCGELVAEMASDYRVQQSDNRVVLSDYLFSLYNGWTASSFVGRPERWLAVAGTSCSLDTRPCVLPWHGTLQGCASNNPRSDNTVCRASALYQVAGGNLPTDRWESTSYQHATSFFAPMCAGSSSLSLLSNPPLYGSLMDKLVSTLNAIP